jgi:hypothetical protein
MTRMKGLAYRSGTTYQPLEHVLEFRPRRTVFAHFILEPI